MSVDRLELLAELLKHVRGVDGAREELRVLCRLFEMKYDAELHRLQRASCYRLFQLLGAAELGGQERGERIEDLVSDLVGEIDDLGPSVSSVVLHLDEPRCPLGRTGQQVDRLHAVSNL